jgi:acetyltransferase-like isoleucine patch superfamily enzyme
MLIGWLLNKLGKKATEDRYISKIKRLKKRGCKIGKNVIIHPSASIDSTYPYMISIGNNCLIGSGAEIICHDSTLNLLNGNHMKVGRVEILDNCVISKKAIILPGVKIGPNVIVTAGSVVNKDIPENTCVCGNPARFYKTWNDFFNDLNMQIEERPKFDPVDISKGDDDLLPDRRKKMIDSTKNGVIFIKGFETQAPYYLKDIEL